MSGIGCIGGGGRRRQLDDDDRAPPKNRTPSDNPPTLRLLTINQQILLLCARVRLNAEQRDQLIALCGEINDWAELIQDAQFRMIIPQVYRHLSAAGPVVPAAALEALREQTVRLNMRSLQFTALQRQLVTEVFQPLNVPYVFVKGVSLSAVYYPEGMARALRDLDVLIPRDAMIAVAERLLTLGFSQPLGQAFNHAHGAAFQQRFSGMMNWVSPQGLLIEIKSEFDSEHQRFVTDDLLNQAQTHPIAGVKTHVLPTATLCAYLAYHHLWHRLARLHWLVDIDAITAHKSFDHQAIMARAEQLNLPTMVASMLRIHQAIALSPDNPGARLENAYDQVIWQGMEACLVGGYHTERYLRRAMSVRGVDQTTRGTPLQRWMKKTARRFSPTVDDFSHLPLPPGWHFAYYLLRPPLWALRKIRSKC